jgi:hypothetical protein
VLSKPGAGQKGRARRRKSIKRASADCIFPRVICEKDRSCVYAGARGPVDRDEVRYAQASKQMMETGNYFDIRFQDQPPYLQLAGIYWLQVDYFRERHSSWHRIARFPSSCESQLFDLRRQIAAAGAVLVKEYVEDGHTGTQLDRPSFNHFERI